MSLFGDGGGRGGLGWLVGLSAVAIGLLGLIFGALLLTRCGAPATRVAESEATATATPTSTATPAATATAIPSATGTPMAPASATFTAVPTETSVPTLTPEPTVTPEPSATPEPTATPTDTPTVRPTNTPCLVQVDPAFAKSRGVVRLGCPEKPANVIWAAGQAFERGYMLWRSDANQITVLYQDGRQQTFADQWQNQRYVIRQAPSGLFAPVRGFGWLWQNNAEVAKALGWGTEEEKGFCIQIQYFVGGLAFRSVTETCGSEFNRATERDFKPLFFIIEYKGGWSR